MKIPKNITLKESPHGQIPSTGSGTWITAAEAAALLKVRPSTVIHRIQNKTLQGRLSEDLPYSYDGKENYLVLLESLPQKAQSSYQMIRSPKVFR